MATPELDPRILRVGIEVSGEIRWYQDLAIRVQGSKLGNDAQNTCQVSIDNLSRDVRNYLLTETSPFNKNRTPKKLYVEAGRRSYGTSRLFVGDITTASPSSLPPDIWLDITAQTGAFLKGNLVARSGAARENLSSLAQRVAEDIGCTLDFQAVDKAIANYSFSGAVLKQVNALARSGLVDVFQDDETLVVKDRNAPLSNRVKKVSADTGMIGVPEVTERGVKVSILFDPDTALGGLLSLTSQLNPSLNGDYTIYKIDFELANREEPFYLHLEASRND